MWDLRYGKEPFDSKLFVLRVIDKIKYVFLAALLGLLLIGGGYYLGNVIFAEGLPYVITTKYEIEFAEDRSTSEVYYYSAYTWNDFAKSSLWSQQILEEVEATIGRTISQEELLASYEITVPSDMRIPYSVVSHQNKEMAMAISNALNQVFVAFSAEKEHMLNIEILDIVGPTLQVADIRTFRACILGGVIGAFFALFGIAYYMLVEEVIYLPGTFAYRYHLPVLGYLDKEGNLSKELTLNISYLFEQKKKRGMIALEEEIDLASVNEKLGFSGTVISNISEDPKGCQSLREMEGNLLLVKAGRRNGKQIEAFLDLMKMQRIKMEGVVLIDADRRLIQRYEGRRG